MINKKSFMPIINEKWCKDCGLCIAFCPNKVFTADSFGRTQVDNQKKCIGCRICEFRCPDFAITIRDT